ncbi:hypothetical protein N7G274_002328 [Stereocaulon virgatum]|uniref:Uncharacterized protein n=1 Tax=Stereocaulon virgatum TaxID=373712 RepID=A0ABR4AHM3_9LECA
MCYMESPVPSRTEFLVSALGIRPRDLFNVNDTGQEDEQAHRREDENTLFLRYYHRFTQFEGEPWPRHGLTEELIAFGLITLEYIVALRSIEFGAGIPRAVLTPMEDFDDLSPELVLPLVEGEERDGDWEAAGLSITRNSQEIWPTRAPSPLDLRESEESPQEIDARGASAEGRDGSSHGDHTGPPLRKPSPVHSSPGAIIDAEEWPTLVDSRTAWSQNSGIGSERQEQDQQFNGNGDVAL